MPIDAVTDLILQYRYWILFPLACLEGPIVAFTTGALAALGYFNVFLAYAVLLLGDLIPDIAYHFFGRYGKRTTIIMRYAGKIGVTEDHIDAVRRMWQEHPGKTMFFTKFAYGLSTPFLILSGFVGMPLRRFLRHSLPLTVINGTVLLGAGYFFGNSFKTVSDTIEIFQFIIGGAGIVALAYYFFARRMRTELMKEEALEERAG